MSHQSRGKGPKSCLTSFFSFMRVITGSQDRVSSWAAAVVVDRVMLLAPERCFCSGISIDPSRSFVCIYVWPSHIVDYESTG